MMTRSGNQVLHRVTGACTLALTAIAVPAAVSVAPAAASTAAASPATAVPTWFRASAMTWTSATRGWVLGARSCGLRHNCATSQVIATTDGGSRWHLAGTIKATIPKLGLGTTGITEIRMATPRVGWAFAPDLYRTGDGGKTWKAMTIPGHGKQILDLAVTPTSVYAIVSPCAYLTGLCGQTQLSAWRTNLAGRPGPACPSS